MNSSAKIILRRPARRDGTCQIRLQVVLFRKPVPVGLGIGWFPELFDEEKGLCLAGWPGRKRTPDQQQILDTAVAWAGGTPAQLEQKASDYNLIIGQALAKTNEIFVNYRLSKQVLTAEGFLEDYNTELSKNDFLQYMRAKIAERHRRGKIKENTRRTEMSTLGMLSEFRKIIPFYSFNSQFAEDFNTFLKKKKRSINTIWARHKHVKTYLALARKDRIKFEDPYQHFRNRTAFGQWKPLPSAELSLLETYYQTLAVGTLHRRVLQKFLFSCFSSLRLSDLKNISQATFEGNEMRFKVQKTYEKKMQEMLLPLSRRALAYLEDSRRENDLEGFHDYADQYSNRVLKDIAERLGLATRLHHHIGRETFATEFIRRGGKVEVLQKLMDHSKISTTMRYVHVDDDMKRAAIQMLDDQDDAIPLMKVS